MQRCTQAENVLMMMNTKQLLLASGCSGASQHNEKNLSIRARTFELRLKLHLHIQNTFEGQQKRSISSNAICN